MTHTDQMLEGEGISEVSDNLPAIDPLAASSRAAAALDEGSAALFRAAPAASLEGLVDVGSSSAFTCCWLRSKKV